MAIPNVFAFVKRDELSVQESIQSSTVHVERDPNQMHVVRRQPTSKLQRLYGKQGTTKVFSYIMERNGNTRITTINRTYKHTN